MGRDSEVIKVERHWEMFSEDFKRLDTSKQELVSAFEARRKYAGGKLTADEYLGVRKFGDGFSKGTMGLVKPGKSASSAGATPRREELLAGLARHGIDPISITSAVPDALLADILRVLDSLKAGAAVKHSDDGETRKVGAHFEKYSEQFAAIGTSKDELIGAFRSLRKRHPGLTAEAYLSGR